MDLYITLYIKSANIYSVLKQAIRLYKLVDNFRGQSSLFTKRNFLLLINERAVIILHITATVKIIIIAKTLSLWLLGDCYRQIYKALMHTVCTLKLPTVANTNPSTLYKLKSKEPTT